MFCYGKGVSCCRGALKSRCSEDHGLQGLLLAKTLLRCGLLELLAAGVLALS